LRKYSFDFFLLCKYSFDLILNYNSIVGYIKTLQKKKTKIVYICIWLSFKRSWYGWNLREYFGNIRPRRYEQSPLLRMKTPVLNPRLWRAQRPAADLQITTPSGNAGERCKSFGMQLDATT